MKQKLKKTGVRIFPNQPRLLLGREKVVELSIIREQIRAYQQFIEDIEEFNNFDSVLRQGEWQESGIRQRECFRKSVSKFY